MVPMSTWGPLALVGGDELNPGNEPQDEVLARAGGGGAGVGARARGGSNASREGGRKRDPVVREPRSHGRGAARDAQVGREGRGERGPRPRGPLLLRRRGGPRRGPTP